MTRLKMVMFIKDGVTFEEDWARSLASHADLVVIRSMARQGEVRPVEGALDTYPLRVPKLRPTRLLAGIRQRLWANGATALLRQCEERHGTPDVVHGHFFSMGALLLRLRIAGGYRYVLTEHSTRLTGRSASHKPLSRAGLRIARGAYQQAELVFFPSRYLESCVTRLGLSGNFMVVGNPVDTGSFPPRRRGPGNRHIVWVGRLEADKDPISALRAFQLALRQIPDLHLDLVGSGPDRRLVERWIQAEGLGGNVTAWGRQPRHVIASLLAESDGFLSSSTVETFGMAVAEALASGVPVAAPNLQPIKELFRDADGVLYRAGDVPETAQAIVEIVRHSHTFEPSVVGQQVRSQFSPDVVGAKVATAISARLDAVTPSHEGLAGNRRPS